MHITIEDLQRQGVFFLSFEGQTYTTLALNLSYGFKQLGIPFWGELESDNFQKSVTKIPIPKGTEENLHNAAIVIVDILFGPKRAFHTVPITNHARNVIFLSISDNINDFILDTPNPLFITHYSSLRVLPYNRKPWAFGINASLIEWLIENKDENRIRDNKILANFRPSMNQSIREMMNHIFERPISQYFEVDNCISDSGRFGFEHYKKLQSYQMCCAYGGLFIGDISKNPHFSQQEPFASFLKKIKMTDDPVVIRWDSWRFWESMALGATTITLDLEKYGCILPEMPQNWKHYIGIDLENINRDIQRIVDNPGLIEQIGIEGQIWALENYSPLAVAKRFIREIENPEFWNF